MSGSNGAEAMFDSEAGACEAPGYLWAKTMKARGNGTVIVRHTIWTVHIQRQRFWLYPTCERGPYLSRRGQVMGPADFSHLEMRYA
jgi:hypothetical protein